MKADAPATAAQGFGNVVHVLADEVASGRTPADLAVLMERLDSVWDALAFDAPWKSRAGEGERARGARTLPALARHGPRRPHAGRHASTTSTSRSKAGEYEVRIRGSMDRVEADARGPRVRRRLQDRQAAPDRATRSPATPSSPSTSSPSARAPSTRSSTAHAPSRAAPNSSSCARAPPSRTAARRAAQGRRRRSRWTGESGSATCSPRPPAGSSTTLHARRGPALHPLRLPQLVQRPAGGPPGVE